MKKTLVALIAACMAVSGLADDADTDILAFVATNAAPVSKTFTSLPLCRRTIGKVYVRKPGAVEWTETEEGLFYPFGSAFKTAKDARLEIAFGAGVFVYLESDSEIGTRRQGIGCPSRTVVLMSGKALLSVPNNLPENVFFVTAPGFTVRNPAGDSQYEYANKGDGDLAIVRCKTGTIGVSGRHFDIPEMHAANVLKIRTSHDQLVSVLTGAGGDYVVNVDQGLRARDEFGDDGKLHTVIEKGNYACHLTPGTKVHINRAVPEIGEHMSVHTMVFEASGDRKSECYFCENRPEINSGELVFKNKVTAEDLAKRADEVEGETTTEESVEEEETSSEEE